SESRVFDLAHAVRIEVSLWPLEMRSCSTAIESAASRNIFKFGLTRTLFFILTLDGHLLRPAPSGPSPPSAVASAHSQSNLRANFRPIIPRQYTSFKTLWSIG